MLYLSSFNVICIVPDKSTGESVNYLDGLLFDVE